MKQRSKVQKKFSDFRGLFSALTVLVSIVIGPKASALSIQCVIGSESTPAGAAESFVSYDEEAGRYLRGTRTNAHDAEENAVELEKTVEGASLTRVADARKFMVTDPKSNAILATFSLSGHPLKPVVHLEQDSGAKPCVATGDVASLFERLIDDPATLSGIAAWREWLKTRPDACDPALDSLSYFQPDAGKKTAIVFHGYGSNPMRMIHIIEVLLDNGYNVIAPRLARHFTKNLHELDKARYAEWIKDSEDVLKIGQLFSDKVLLTGFSLGGILAGRLAIKYPEKIDSLILFAPAWRVSSVVSLGTSIGSPFLISLNYISKMPEACKIDKGYISSRGGRQVESLATLVETSNEGMYPAIDTTAYAKIKAPHIIFTTPKDEAIDADAVGKICEIRPKFCGHISVPGRTHTTLLDDLDQKAEQGYEGITMRELMTRFLNEQ